MSDEAEATRYASEVCPKIPTVVKYVTMLVDTMVSDVGAEAFCTNNQIK